MDTETIRDALSALSDEAPELTDRKRKYCRQMDDGNWYTHSQCARYYGNRAHPPESHPYLQGTELACRFLRGQRKDLIFRLKYPFGQAHEEQEAEKRLADITERLEYESDLLARRREAAYRHWQEGKVDG